MFVSDKSNVCCVLIIVKQYLRITAIAKLPGGNGW